MEPVEFKTYTPRELPAKDWATTGLRNHNGHKNVINSLVLHAIDLEAHNIHLQEKYALIKVAEQKAELLHCDDAELVVVAYGSTARIVKTAIAQLRDQGHRVGLLRPISLWPFPEDAFAKVMPVAKNFLCVEMSAGQMVEDVKLVVNGARPVHFYGRMGGIVPTPNEIATQVLQIMGVK